MATKGARAALFDTSLKRLQAAIDTVSERLGVAPLVIPSHDRDADMLPARQLEAMANWTESLAEEFRAPVVEALDGKTAEDGDRDTGDADTEQKPTARKRPTPPRAADTKGE